MVKMKILLDVNIILDFFDDMRSRSKESILAYELMNNDREIEMCIYQDSITTIHYILKMTIDEIEELIDKFNVIESKKSDLKEAITIVKSGKMKDFEDATILAAACREDVACIVTNDKDFLKIEEYGGVEVGSPEMILQEYDFEKDIFGEWIPKDEIAIAREIQAKKEKE